MRAPTPSLLALLLAASSGCGEPAPPDARQAARDVPAAAPEATRATRPAEGAVPRASAAGPASDAPLPATELVDEAQARGLDYRNRSGSAAKRVILEANGAGVAVLDLGPDGDLDLVFAQGASSIPPRDLGPPELFENTGGGRFERRALEAPGAWWTGLAAGDLDGDGDDDLVVAGFGVLEVFLQQDGRLVRAAGAIPPAVLELDRDGRRVASWFTSLALLDADRDGVLDLYAGRYLDLDLEHPPLGALGTGALAIPCRWKGHEVFCGPAGLVPQPDLCLRGRGDGTFEDASARWLAGHVAGYTLGVLAFDADGDLDTDLFVANDTSPDLLLVNDGHGLFTDVARAAGVALSSEGRMQAGMGAAAGDVDRDGLLDFAVTNFSDEPTELFLGAPQGFRRATNAFGLLGESRSLLSWGVHLVDFDGDGWLELLTMNGHVYPQADHEHTGTSYGQPATLWRLGPQRKAVRVAPHAASSVLRAASGARGSAIGDFDLDGAPDVVLVRIDAPAALGMNRTQGDAARLAVRLLGPATPSERAPRTPRDGRGATAIVVVGRGAEEHALLAETQTAAGFQSSSTPWLHFGLGRALRYERLIVRWPSGRVDELPGGAANARIVVREGAGVVAQEGWR